MSFLVNSFVYSAAVSGPAFHALTPDTGNDYTMEGVLVGTGDLTTTHTSVLYALDIGDTSTSPFGGPVYQQFPANAEVWSGGRCVLSGSPQAGSDVSSVHGNESGGAPLAEVPYLQYYPAATNSLTYSRNLTDASWTKTTMTNAYTSVGIDGVANSATRLTATGANSTAIHSAVTAASATHAGAFWIKRITGTGTVEVTLDNGSTWQAVTLTASYQKFTVEQAALTDPVVGIRIVTSGDAIDVGNAGCHTAKTINEVRGLGPIFTTSAAVSTDATVYGFDIANLDANEGALYLEFMPSEGAAQSCHQMITSLNGRQLYQATISMRTFGNAGGGATSAKLSVARPQDINYKLAAVYSLTDGLCNVNMDGTYTTDAAFSAYAVDAGSINLMTASTSVSVSWPYASMKLRDIRRYESTSLAGAKTTIDGLMP